MHSRLVRQDRNLCLLEPAYLSCPEKRLNFLSNGAILKTFRILIVIKLCQLIYFMIVSIISYGLGPKEGGGEDKHTNRHTDIATKRA